MNPWKSDWTIAIPFANLKEAWKEMGNSIWLLLGLSDMVTKEFDYGGIRIGAVLGGARLTDEYIAHRFEGAFRPATVRAWRRRLIKAGAIAQRRIPAGLQIVVLGTHKFNAARLSEAPKWVRAAVQRAAKQAGVVID